MFSRKREPTLIELVTDKTVRALNDHPIGSQEYEKVMNALIQLHRMREAEKPSSISKDTLVLAGTNLLGIIMIIRHEHVNVITSRAMNLVIKPR